ncbi:MAG: S1 RNA-binding domain-containing protein [Gammaproteobacteria bacterium]|nr:S1 RNA-binding domain-containing protein [Gammaproteobacteria bacterium]
MERRADEATRDVIEWLKCEYMLDKVGDIFDGVISSVTSFGLFVELKDIYVEGLVHITSLGKDYFNYDALRHCLYAQRTHQFYRLGDVVTIRVVRVDLDERHIDVELVEKTGKHKKACRKK